MEIYLVGGAVRDELLGLPVTERDWVVVSSTPEAMIKLGFKPVGKDFPVFLHPKTHEEYALARTERKIGKGYTGFKFYADESVTLEEDLRRRDLTINAIAKTQAGKLIDPYGGAVDLENKILRHVSEAFAEDPVRILRIGRFASRFGDFIVHPDTMELMRAMVKNGEVDALVAERVWKELQRTLILPYPHRFFEVLQQCGALEILFPEIAAEFDLAMAALHRAASSKDTVCFAALTNSIQVQNLCKRLRIPSNYCELALLVAKYKSNVVNILSADAETTLNLLEHVDAFRRPQRFKDFLLTCEFCVVEDLSQQTQKLANAYEAAAAVPIQPILDRGLVGDEIKKELHRQRLIPLNPPLVKEDL